MFNPKPIFTLQLQCMAAVKPLSSFILGNSCSFKGIDVYIFTEHVIMYVNHR